MDNIKKYFSKTCAENKDSETKLVVYQNVLFNPNDVDDEDIEEIELETPTGERVEKKKEVVTTENDPKVETSKLLDSKIPAEKQSAFWRVKELNQQKEIKMTYTESSQSTRSSSNSSSNGSVTGNNRCLICGKYGHNHNICYYNPDNQKPKTSQANKAKRKRRNAKNSVKAYFSEVDYSHVKRHNESKRKCQASRNNLYHNNHFQSSFNYQKSDKRWNNQQSDFDSFDNSRWPNCQGNNLWSDEFAYVQQNVNMNNSMFSIPEQRSRFDPNQDFSQNCSQVIPNWYPKDVIVIDRVTQQPKIITIWVLMNN